MKQKEDRSERKAIVLVTHMRFLKAVDSHEGTEEEKIAVAKQFHPKSKKRSRDADADADERNNLVVAQFLYKMSHEGGGVQGMLG